MPKKIVVTTGTRADYGLLRPIIKKLIKNKNFKLYLIVTGTHLSKKHGYTINEIIKDKIPIYSKFIFKTSNDDSFFVTKEFGKSIIKFAKIFNKIKPDLNLILGDRVEMLASALTASQMNILNAHIHGGDVSGGIDEYNRHAITKISNIHFAATKKSQERIIKMGENPNYVYFVGSPGIDEISKNKISNKKTLKQKYGIQLEGDEIILVQHPVTTQIELAETQIIKTLKAIVKIKKPTIVIYPNSDPGNKIIFKQIKLFAKNYSFINVFPSIPRSDYLGFLKNCGVLVGNSSSGLIESAYLKIPVVNIGIRQEKRERGKNVLDVKNDSIISIQNAILKSLNKKKSIHGLSDTIYGKGNASKNIVQILEKINLNENLIQKQIQY